MIIGTTGFDDAGKAAIAQAAQLVCGFAANFSVSVNLVHKLLEKAAKVMGDYTDIKLLKHITPYKVDAPSGTALAMGESITRGRWDVT